MDSAETFSPFQTRAIETARDQGWTLLDRHAVPLGGGGKPMPVLAYRHEDGRIDTMMIAGNGQRTGHEMLRPGDPDYEEISTELPAKTSG
jgi:hypothetical protein